MTLQNFFGVRTARGAEHLGVPSPKPAATAKTKPKKPRAPRKKKADEKAADQDGSVAGVEGQTLCLADTGFHQGDSAAAFDDSPGMLRYFDLPDEEHVGQ